jgi:hypothetical protein
VRYGRFDEWEAKGMLYLLFIILGIVAFGLIIAGRR